MDYYSSTIETVRIEWRPSNERISKVSGGIEASVPASTRRSKRLLGKILTMIAFGVLTSFVAVNVGISAILVEIGAQISGTQAVVSSSIAKTAMASIFTILQIFVLTPVYWKFLVWLSDFENYRLNTNYQNALIWKQFLLNFVNSYGLVFFSGLIKPILVQIDSTHSINIFGQPNSCTTLNGISSCLSSMVTNIAIVFVGTQFLSQLIEIAYPWFIEQTTRRKLHKKRNRENVPIYMNESDLLRMTPDLFQVFGRIFYTLE